MSHDELQYHTTDISSSCALALLEIAAKCLYCSSEKDYKEIFGLLNKILPFDKSTSGLADLDGNNAVVSYELINVNYPDEWLKIYKDNEFSKDDVIVQNHFANFVPQYWDFTYKKSKQSHKIVSMASAFNIRHGYTFGSRPFGFCKKASLYSFSGNFKAYDARIVSILLTIVPHMHLASSRILKERRIECSKDMLSGREIEVLNWLKHGKSSWDISVILDISESTVNFHIYNIMKKLDVVNRPQAVAVATHLGVLDID
jgi:LuxR family transcriptional regulator, quorum-sensing system regulator CviR